MAELLGLAPETMPCFACYNFGLVKVDVLLFLPKNFLQTLL